MSSAPDALKEEIKRAIVESLRLPIPVDEIENGLSLFGEGLGLDSIDVLEIALAISKAYGVKLRSDNKNNAKIFSSLRSLSQHIQAHRAS